MQPLDAWVFSVQDAYLSGRTGEQTVYPLGIKHLYLQSHIYMHIYIHIYGKFLGFACISRTTVDLSSLRGLELNFFFIVPLECKV